MVVLPYLRIVPPGGPIWWDSPRPADLIGWAKAGCPTAEKPGKKRKADEEGEAWSSVRGAPTALTTSSLMVTNGNSNGHWEDLRSCWAGQGFGRIKMLASSCGFVQKWKGYGQSHYLSVTSGTWFSDKPECRSFSESSYFCISWFFERSRYSSRVFWNAWNVIKRVILAAF